MLIHVKESQRMRAAYAFGFGCAAGYDTAEQTVYLRENF
jgi:hypothetical protein